MTIRERIYSLLRWSEKYTKTDMIYLTKGGFWLTVAKVVSALASLISSIAFANLLPEHTYGVYRYVLSMASLLAIPALYGMEAAITKSIAQGKGGNVKQAVYTRMRWGVLGAIASLVLGAYYLAMGDITLGLTFAVTAIFVPFMEPFNSFSAILNGHKKFNLLAFYTVSIRLLVTLVVVTAILFTDDIILIVGLFFGATTILRFLCLKMSVRRTNLEATDDPFLTNYGKHLSLMGAFSKVATHADKILIFQQVGGVALATFYLALIPFKQIQNVFNSLATLAMPKFSSNQIKTLKETLPRKLLVIYLFVVPTIILYLLAAPYIFELLYPQYLDAVLMSQILMLQLLFFPLTLVGTVLTAQGHKNQLYFHTLSYSLIRITLLVILIPLYGVYGAIFGIIATNAVSSLILVVLFWRS